MIDTVHNRRFKQRFHEHLTTSRLQKGKVGYILLWLLGIPIPVLLLIFCCGAAIESGYTPDK
jgi:hypothetical protein